MGISSKALVSIFIILTVGLSSARVLDDYVDDYTTNSIKNAALTYATARGINALVSMMQSSEVQAGVGIVSGSMTIGELLDPINDMIERFSTIMTWVLASLGGAKGCCYCWRRTNCSCTWSRYSASARFCCCFTVRRGRRARCSEPFW